jgi:hypothetical protein
MYAFLRLFLRGTWERSPILPSFSDALKNSWKDTSELSLFRCFVLLLSHERRVAYLRQWTPDFRESLEKQLADEWRKRPTNLPNILNELSLDEPSRPQILPVYRRLLAESDDQIHKIVIEDLHRKFRKMSSPRQPR